MAKTIRALTVKIGGDSKALRRELARSKKSVNSFGSELKKMKGMIAGAFAVGSVLAFAKASVSAYDKQAKAESELLVALKGRKSAQQDLIAQAQRLQKTTLFGDEETIHADALIGAFVKMKSQIKQIIPLVQDFATAKKMKLAAAADLVSKTLGSTTNALTRYGIQVKGAVGSNERLQTMVKGLSDAFKGQAEAAALAGAGGLKQLSNLWGDMKEKIGGVIYQGIKPFVGALKELMTPSEDLIGNLQKEKEEANLLATQLTNTNLSAKDRNSIYQKLKSQYPDILKGINKEKIDVKKLAENLDHYNESMLRKIMMEQQNEKLNKLIKTEGEAKISRAKAELALTKSIIDNLPKFASSDAERAKKAKEILKSNSDIYDKYKKIRELISKSMLAGDYTTANLTWNKIDNIAHDVLKTRQAETEAEKNTKAQSDENYQIYRKIFHLKKGSVQLSLEQRNAIDEYNRIFGTTLDYSKALTKEQQSQLDQSNQSKETIISLQKMEQEVDKLKTKRDELAKKAFVNPNAVPASAVKQIDDLDKQIAGLEKKIEHLKSLTPETGSSTAITPMQPLQGPTNVATTLNPEIIVKPHYSTDQSSLTNFQKTFISGWSNAVGQMQMALADLFSNLANSIGESIGNLLSGVPTNFGKDFIAMMGGFIKQLGQILIEFGSLMLAFSILKNKPNPITAMAAIAAGIAAVAIGTVLMNTVKKKSPAMAEGGQVPLGYPNDTYPARLTSGEIVVPPKKLGNALSEIMARMNPANALAGFSANMPGQEKMSAIPVEVKVSGVFRQAGTDLVAVVEQTQINRTRIRGY